MVKIPLLINAFIVFFFTGMGLLESRRLLRHNPGKTLEAILKRTYYIYVTLPLMILLFISNLYLQKHTQIIWDFPIWLQYWLGTIVWVLTLVMNVFLFSLVSFLSLKTRHKEKIKVIISGVLFIVLLEAILWIYTKPLSPKLFEKISRDGFIMQTDAATCLAASAANVIKTFGIDKSEKDMAELFGTSYLLGTSLSQAVVGMRKIGFNCTPTTIQDADIAKMRHPSVLFIDYIGKEDHAVAFMDYENNTAEIWDPLYQRKKFFTREKFKSRWHGRGITFDPQKNK